MNSSNKTFVYHRALNSERAFKAFVEKSRGSDYRVAAEGDICWAYINSHSVIYIHHPDMQGKSLSNERVEELLLSGELLTLERLFKINSEVNFILELKTGSGEIGEFFIAFKELLERYRVHNVVVDTFSVRQLQALKKVIPDIETSLHTKFVYANYIAETTFEKPYFALHKLSDLEFIDIITISYTTTHVNLLNLDIDSSYRALLNAGKKLRLGSIKSMRAFKKGVDSNADALYLRSAEVLDSYEAFLATPR